MKRVLYVSLIKMIKTGRGRILMVWENVKLAFKSMLSNKMRTVLSLLGIVIGVTSVVAILSLGNSAKKSISSSISTAGTDLVTIYANNSSKAATTFTEEFSQTLEKAVEGIETIIPVKTVNARVRNEKTIKTTTVYGVSSNWNTIMKYETEQGQWFSADDNIFRRQVVVLGASIAKNLFPGGNAVGNYVSIFRNQSKRYLVIGVMEEKDSTLSVSFDNNIFIPYNTLSLRIVNASTVGSYIVKVLDGFDSTVVSDSLQDYLDSLVGSDAYTIFTAATLTNIANEITGTFTTFLAAIAGISLLVGGIGIMNIMLVSVAERTREIGIRKALGASPVVIRRQFLIEAVVLTMAGGLIGILLGTLISRVITNFAGWTFFASFTAYIVSVGFSALIGIFFGAYPARKAANLDPIESLNHE